MYIALPLKLQYSGIAHLRSEKGVAHLLAENSPIKPFFVFLINTISKASELCFFKEYSKVFSAISSSPLEEVPINILTILIYSHFRL